MRQILLILFCTWLSACSYSPKPQNENPVDVLLIGGGIMSATLGSLIRELDPNLTIELYEKLDQVALESSNAWNNAGTGHAAFCELNYTPQLSDGSIKIDKALRINESFEISKQFWGYQVQKNNLPSPKSFINNVSHISFLWGKDNIDFLKSRHLALKEQSLFADLEYTEDKKVIESWAPLLMQSRQDEKQFAATRMKGGTDVNFGVITTELVNSLKKTPNTLVHLAHEVLDIKRNKDNTWSVVVRDIKNNLKKAIKTRFVFIGAGGHALTLLQKSGIEESKHFGGFPVGGAFLVSENSKVAHQHLAKVYGIADVGSPPMSVPHLDSRFIDGKRMILFGPFATFTPKFLKSGSFFDLFSSISFSNVIPLIQAGFKNFDLTLYLIKQLMLSKEEKFAQLQKYFPSANLDDWREINAGQRVQIVKKDPEKGGVLQFGTELVRAKDGSLIALLGASPGASTSVTIALDALKIAFPQRLETSDWQLKIAEIFPSYEKNLNDDVKLFEKVKKRNQQHLNLIR